MRPKVEGFDAKLGQLPCEPKDEQWSMPIQADKIARLLTCELALGVKEVVNAFCESRHRRDTSFLLHRVKEISWSQSCSDNGRG